MRMISLFIALLFSASPLLRAGDVSGEFIFPLQEKHVHSSSIVEAPNGDLIVCWFYGSGERTAPDVRIRGARLKKGTEQWSPVFEMADTYNLPDCNPVLFIDRNDKLWLFWIAVQAVSWEHSVLRYRTSTDYLGDGAPKWNWQGVILLQPGQTFADTLIDGLKEIGPRSLLWKQRGAEYLDKITTDANAPALRQTGWMTRTHPLILPNGRILLPLYSDGYNIGLVAFSDDDGVTWRASGPIVGLGNIQPSLVRRQDGTLLAFMRDNGGPPKRVQMSTSIDNGETWSLAQDMNIPNPGSSIEAIALQNGVWIFVGNDLERGRHQLVVKKSTDEGRTWQTWRYLEKNEPGDGSFAYPSVIQTRDGLVHVTYSYHTKSNGKTIKHVSFLAPKP